MKKYILIILLFSISTHSQKSENLDLYRSFLTEMYSERFIEKNNFDNDIYKYNFSSLWLLPGLTDVDYVGYGMPSERPELKGFIGKNYQRIYIRFIQITKNPDNPKEYKVYGKSNANGNICEFNGVFKIELIKKFNLNYNAGEDFLVNIDSVKEQGLIICNYELHENPKEKATGIFKGKLITSFFIDINGKLKYNAIKGFSDSYKNNQFEGKWISFKTKKAKPCNFGEWKTPNSGDLNIGAGEFSPNKKYFNKGWGENKIEGTRWWE